MRLVEFVGRRPILTSLALVAIVFFGVIARAQNAQVNGHVAIGGPYVDAYGTDLWVANNIHVQGAVENDQNGGKERLRVGTSWGYPGLYAETDSLGMATDLVLGASSGWIRIGPDGGGQSLRVSGDVQTNGLQLHGQVVNGGSTATPKDLFLQANNASNLYLSFGGGNTNVGSVFTPGPQKLNVYGNTLVTGSIYSGGSFFSSGHEEFFFNPAFGGELFRSTFSRDATGACCAPNGDFTIGVAENSVATGHFPSIQFHAAGLAEGYVRLVSGTNGVPPGARTDIPERHFTFGSYGAIMSGEFSGALYATNVQTEQGLFTKGNGSYWVNPATYSQMNTLYVQNPVNFSSRALKANVQHLGTSEVDELLREVDSMRLARFNYRDRAHGGVEATTHVGFIAEEMPSHLTTDGSRGIMMADLTATAIGAIKAQQAQIAEQRHEIAELKARLSKLERAGRR